MGREATPMRDQKVQDVFPGFWPVETDAQGSPSAARKEIEFRTAAGNIRFLGLSISPLRTSQNQNTGFVYNFQDLTQLKRLEREVLTKERMAALGRLSAAIAHEIRQPLTAMTGALKELARLAPLEDDDKKLVQIVSRESQRLNQIITDFFSIIRAKENMPSLMSMSCRSLKKHFYCSSDDATAKSASTASTAAFCQRPQRPCSCRSRCPETSFLEPLQ